MNIDTNNKVDYRSRVYVVLLCHCQRLWVWPTASGTTNWISLQRTGQCPVSRPTSFPPADSLRRMPGKTRAVSTRYSEHAAAAGARCGGHGMLDCCVLSVIMARALIPLDAVCYCTNFLIVQLLKFVNIRKCQPFKQKWFSFKIFHHFFISKFLLDDLYIF